MIVVLLGPPGAGKGTQGERIATKLGVPKVATGDLLRAAVRDGTPLGLEAKAAMDRGDLVPDEVILGIIKDALAQPENAKGAILDGVVRTVPQAEGLSKALSELGRKVDAILLFDVKEDELVRRLSDRTVCEKCQTPYLQRAPGTKCDKCGGTLMRRKDDEPESVRNRLKVYKDQTEPVINWYKTNGAAVKSIDATGQVDQITERAMAALQG